MAYFIRKNTSKSQNIGIGKCLNYYLLLFFFFVNRNKCSLKFVFI